MTEPAGSPQEKATEDALNWLIVLREEPQDEHVRARFLLWLNGAEVNRAAWGEAAHLWTVMGRARPEGIAPITGLPLAPAPPPETVPPGLPAARAGLRNRILGGMAGLALVLLAVAYAPALMLRMQADHITPAARITQVVLEDGSTVTLGGASAIAVDFTADSRALRLLAGEAWFEVRPDPARPFTVEAGDLQVTVLGTGFDMRLGGSGASVAVGHGRVAVGGYGSVLETGDWLYRGEDGGIETGEVAPGIIGGWRDGMLVVRDRPVADVAEVLGRYLPGGVTTIGGGSDRMRVTGVYDLTDPQASLEALRAAHDGRLWRLPGGRVIFSLY